MKNNEPVFFSTWGKDYTPPINNLQVNNNSNFKDKEFKINLVKKENQTLNIILNKDENNEYNIGTYNADVQIIIEQDMVLYFEDALKGNVVTGNDILNQAIIDEKNGLCKKEIYKDGGSTEFIYDDFTILKYNTIDDNNDLIIGYGKSIINEIK